MSFTEYLKSIILFKPWPLNEEWKKFSDDCLVIDNKAPVNITHIKFVPSRHVACRLIESERINFLIEELTDCLIYFTSEEVARKGAYLYVDSISDNIRKDFEVKISLIPKVGKKRSFLQISFSHEQISEALELAITRSLKKILRKYTKVKKLGMEFTFSITPAHKQWQVPAKFKSLSF